MFVPWSAYMISPIRLCRTSNLYCHTYMAMLLMPSMASRIHQMMFAKACASTTYMRKTHECLRYAGCLYALVHCLDLHVWPWICTFLSNICFLTSHNLSCNIQFKHSAVSDKLWRPHHCCFHFVTLKFQHINSVSWQIRIRRWWGGQWLRHWTGIEFIVSLLQRISLSL